MYAGGDVRSRMALRLGELVLQQHKSPKDLPNNFFQCKSPQTFRQQPGYTYDDIKGRLLSKDVISVNVASIPHEDSPRHSVRHQANLRLALATVFSSECGDAKLGKHWKGVMRSIWKELEIAEQG